MPFVPSAEGKPPFPRKGDAISVSGRAANGYPVKGGAPVRKLGRRIVFWRSQNVRSKRGLRDFCGAGRPRPAKLIRWMEWRAGVVAPHGWTEALFTSYVLLRKTQSSPSLRLTAPFKVQINSRNRRKTKTNSTKRMRMDSWKTNSSNYTAPFANAMIADLEKNYNAKATTIVPNLQMRS